MILLNVVPLSFLQKHFTYKRWTGNNWVILSCGILFLVYMSKLHSHVKNMGYREMGLVSTILLCCNSEHSWQRVMGVTE